MEELWIARNPNNELWLFTDEPELKTSRDGTYQYWWVEGTDFYYSSLIIDDEKSHPEVTFENSPQKVKIVINK